MSWGFIIAVAALALLLGLSIQRGATCLVLAVEQWVMERRFGRMQAIIEAGLLVTFGMLLTWPWFGEMGIPAAFVLSWMTVIGAILLGIGAVVNRGCVFGTLVHIGSGRNEWFFSIIGFFVGCCSFFFLPMPVSKPFSDKAVLAFSAGLPVVLKGGGLLLLAGLLIWRLRMLTRPSLLAIWPAHPKAGHPLAGWRQQCARLNAHGYTLLIGVSYLMLFALAGSWAYTDALAEFARSWLGQGMESMTTHTMLRLLLVAMILVGSIVGGVVFGQQREWSFKVHRLPRCFLGGLLMGLGSTMVPGSNDSLLLTGLPLLFLHAWVSFIVMCLVIALCIWPLQRRSS